MPERNDTVNGDRDRDLLAGNSAAISHPRDAERPSFTFSLERGPPSSLLNRGGRKERMQAQRFPGLPREGRESHPGGPQLSPAIMGSGDTGSAWNSCSTVSHREHSYDRRFISAFCAGTFRKMGSRDRTGDEANLFPLFSYTCLLPSWTPVSSSSASCLRERSSSS
jgi:hypothetical protein